MVGYLIALLILIPFVVLLVAFPIWTFVDCIRNPDLSKQSKIAWCCLIFFTWLLGASVYSFVVSRRPLFRSMAGVAVCLILFGLYRQIRYPNRKAAGDTGFDNLIKASKGAQSLGNLGAMRSALAIYYGDTVGKYPSRPEDLLKGQGSTKYLVHIPALTIPDHPTTAEIVIYPAHVCQDHSILGNQIKDTGKWGYVADPKASCYGTIFIDCTHTRTGKDRKAWFEY